MTENKKETTNQKTIKVVEPQDSLTVGGAEIPKMVQKSDADS